MHEIALALASWLSGGKDRDVVISTRVRFARNLNDALFPWRASLTEASETRDRLSQTIRSLVPSINEYQLEGLDLATLRAFSERSWIDSVSSSDPSRSLFLTDEGATLFLLNEIDHFRVASFGAGSDVSAPYERSHQYESLLDAELSWAANEKQGYLTSRIEDVGSGLRISALVFIPGILSSGVFDRVARGLLDSGIEPRLRTTDYAENERLTIGTKDDDKLEAQDTSPYVELSANAKLGLSEDSFISSFTQSLLSLVEGERRTRERLLKSRQNELEDASFRAAALLYSARLLKEEETRRMLGDLRSGLAYGFLHEAQAEEKAGNKDMYAYPDALRLLIGPACLRMRQEAQKKNNSIEQMRAELVRATLPRYDI
ncbi:ATP--guanido phosphotransferase [Treponema sp.]